MRNTRIRTTSFWVSTLILALSSRILPAQEVLELDDLLVTAGLQPISIDDVASSVTVITHEEIEQKQAKTLAELFRDVPGFSVNQAGGVGALTQIRVRGAEANQILVLVDGIRANDPALGDEFQFQFALTANIERVEIIRGPQSATWGSDALAGVINIIRRKDVAGQHLSGNIESGSFGSLSVDLDGGYAGEIFKLSGGLSYLQTNGTNISRSGNEKDDAENSTGNIAVEFDAGNAFSLRFSGQVVDASSQFDEIDFFVTGLPADADRVTESRQTFLAGELWLAPQLSPWSGNFSVYSMDSDNNNFSDGNWTNSTAAQTLEFRLRAGVVFGAGEAQNHRLNFALERETVDFSQRGEASPSGNPNQDQSYDINGYAIEYVGKPFTGFTWALSTRLDEYSDFDDAVTWQTAASYQLSPGLRLRGSVGAGSKAPTFTERYGFFEDLFIGNPELKPESSRNWEFGIDTDWAEGRYQLQLAYFNQDLQDEIDGFVFDPVSFLFTGKNKASDSKRQGIEAILDLHLGRSFLFGAAYTYTDATEKSVTGQSVREVRRPKHMASLSANYRFAADRGNLNLNLNYNGPQLDMFFSPTTFTLNRVAMDAYTLLDLAATWKLTASFELTGRASNLLNEQYEEILGFVRPGRGVFAGLRGRF